MMVFGLMHRYYTLHLEEKIFLAEYYLTDFGVMYVSFKSGTSAGKDIEGRYFTNVTREIVQKIVAERTTFDIVESWETEDGLMR